MLAPSQVRLRSYSGEHIPVVGSVEVNVVLQAAICQTAIVGGTRRWSQLVGSKLVVPVETRLAGDTSPVDHSTSNVVGQI